jgi:hypothetical protein
VPFRYKDVAQQGTWVDAVTRVTSDPIADDVSDYNSSDDEPGRIRSYKKRSGSSDFGPGSQAFHSGPALAGDKSTPGKSHAERTGTKSGGISGRSGRGGRGGGRIGGDKSGTGTGLERGAPGPSRADDSSLPSIEQSVAMTSSTTRSDTDLNRGTNMNAQSNRSSDNALINAPASRRTDQETAASKGVRGPKGGSNSTGRVHGWGGGRTRGRRGGSGFGSAYVNTGPSIPLEGQYEHREPK